MALPITEAMVRRVAGELSDGGWRYSLRQLYYACCADAETIPGNASAKGELSLGVLMLLVALILIGFRPVFIALASSGMLLIALGVTHRRAPRQRSRVLVMSYADFERRYAGLELPGLLPSVAAPPAAGHAATLVVCDTAETAALVAANRKAAGLQDVDVCAADATATRVYPRVAALHDASPGGCLLAVQLGASGADVIDCGLRPAAVAGDCQVLEGAPARVAPELSDVLSEAEVDWLRSGRRVELATLRPGALLELVAAALSAEASGSARFAAAERL